MIHKGTIVHNQRPLAYGKKFFEAAVLFHGDQHMLAGIHGKNLQNKINGLKTEIQLFPAA